MTDKSKPYRKVRRAWLNPVSSTNTGWYQTIVENDAWQASNKVEHYEVYAGILIHDCNQSVTLDFSENGKPNFRKLNKFISALEAMNDDMLEAETDLERRRAEFAKAKAKKEES